MSKYLIFGATGSIGSNLAEKLYNSDKDVHLLGRDEEELKKLSSKLNSEYTVIDILNDDISKIIKNSFDNVDVSGVAYCVGSIDLKPLKSAKKEDRLKKYKALLKFRNIPFDTDLFTWHNSDL